MILELYLLSFVAASVVGGEVSAVTDWTEQENVDRRREWSLERTLCEGKRVLQGKREARGERIVACIAARGEEWSERV